MRGGIVMVRGNAGARAGDRLRRGTIVIEGGAGDYAGSRMIAGTLIVRAQGRRAAGLSDEARDDRAGRRRARLSPTFADCGMHRLVAMRLMAGYLKPYSGAPRRCCARPLRRLRRRHGGIGPRRNFPRENSGQ